jgi:Coenzyme PQQ synthesis protein D (PqqD)
MTEPASDRTTFRPSPDVLMRKVGDEFVLVHMGRNQIFSLNPTAAALWELLSEGRTRADAIAQLTREFDVDLETAEAETDTLLGMLEREGLVEAQRR